MKRNEAQIRSMRDEIADIVVEAARVSVFGIATNEQSGKFEMLSGNRAEWEALPTNFLNRALGAGERALPTDPAPSLEEQATAAEQEAEALTARVSKLRDKAKALRAAAKTIKDSAS